jgi:hypothetical protein
VVLRITEESKQGHIFFRVFRVFCGSTNDMILADSEIAYEAERYAWYYTLYLLLDLNIVLRSDIVIRQNRSTKKESKLL